MKTIKRLFLLLLSCILLSGCGAGGKAHLSDSALDKLEKDLLDSLVICGTVDSATCSIRNHSEYDMQDVYFYDKETDINICGIQYLPAKTGANNLYCGLQELPEGTGEVYVVFTIGQYRYTSKSTVTAEFGSSRVEGIHISVQTSHGRKELTEDTPLIFEDGVEIEDIGDTLKSLEVKYSYSYDGKIRAEITVHGKKRTSGYGHEVAKLFGSDDVIYGSSGIFLSDSGEDDFTFYSLNAGDYLLVIEE